jgi:hypothetical protein
MCSWHEWSGSSPPAAGSMLCVTEFLRHLDRGKDQNVEIRFWSGKWFHTEELVLFFLVAFYFCSSDCEDLLPFCQPFIQLSTGWNRCVGWTLGKAEDAVVLLLKFKSMPRKAYNVEKHLNGNKWNVQEVTQGVFKNQSNRKYLGKLKALLKKKKKKVVLSFFHIISNPIK